MSRVGGVFFVFGFFVFFIFGAFPQQGFASVASSTSGRILLEVERNGEAWYVDPLSLQRHFLGRPDDAYAIMRSLGLGISNADLERFDHNRSMRARLAGRILLAVESHGEAYYVDPSNLEKYYLGRPADAFAIMSSRGLGMSSANLALIPSTGGATSSNTISISGVPFTAQAPFADWGDIRQQEACEEASALMAMHWVWADATLTQQEALSEILEMTNWEERVYGYHHDTSAAETAKRLFNEWFAFYNLDVVYDVTVDDLIHELKAGHLLVVPVNGTALGNPYYRGVVERHMVVIRGYDETTEEFILHDPGTRYGENMRFSKARVAGALRDYASGVYAPIGSGRTAMVVIYK